MSNVTLQLPDDVLARARRMAEREQVDLDDLVSRALDEITRSDEWFRERVIRGKLVSRERFLDILAGAPDVEPEPSDRIE